MTSWASCWGHPAAFLVQYEGDPFAYAYPGGYENQVAVSGFRIDEDVEVALPQTLLLPSLRA